MASRLATTVRVATQKLPQTRKAINITPSAVSKLKALLKSQQGAIGIRLGVKARGCSGLSYALNFTDKKQKFDEEVNEGGVRVFIDPKALLTVIGTEMDYVEDKLSSEFVFSNPNAKGLCGCGESFTV